MKNKKTFNTQVENILSGKANHETSETLKLIREGLITGRELKREDREYIDDIKTKMGVDLNSPSDADAIRTLIDGVEVKQNALRQQAGSRDPAAQLVELESAYAKARVAALKDHQGLFADLGCMQGNSKRIKGEKRRT